MEIISLFQIWTSMPYQDHSLTAIIKEFENIRLFLKSLSQTLRLFGFVKEINEAIFWNELERFEEYELEVYIKIMGIDVGDLLIIREEDQSKKDMMHFILSWKVRQLEKLRLWRWRQEVFVGGIGSRIEEFPGQPNFFEFETNSDLRLQGISTYFLLVGETRRETLMDMYEYFDLYHMAGCLALFRTKEVEFNTSMTLSDLADLIMSLLKDLEINPFNLLTPLGIIPIGNSEFEEINFKMLYKAQDLDDMKLIASKMGIPLLVHVSEVLPDGSTFEKLEPKEATILYDDIASAYFCPRFFSRIENWRNVVDAIGAETNSINGHSIFESKEDMILFYGVPGTTYQFFTFEELEMSFVHGNFYIPSSIAEFPTNISAWERFSESNIRRLQMTVLKAMYERSAPEIQEKIEKLSDKISENLALINQEIPEVFDMKPRQRQEYIVKSLQTDLNETAMTTFLLRMMSVGSEISDWDTKMIEIGSLNIAVVLEDDPSWKEVDPTFTRNLDDKIFDIIFSLEEIMSFEDMTGFNVFEFVKDLRLVRMNSDVTMIEWNDDSATIWGRMQLMYKAADLGLYDYVRISAAHLMVTSKYYYRLFFGRDMSDVVIGISLNDSNPLEDQRDKFELAND